MLKINFQGQDAIEFTADSLEGADIQRINEREFHILKDGRSWNAEILEFNKENKTIRLKLNGTIFEAQIQDKMDQLLDKMGLSDLQSGKTPNLMAPMPGLVLDIRVEVGQNIEKGNSLLVLEAMKMENVLKAAGEAVIKKIAVAKGDAVEKGQLLIEFE